MLTNINANLVEFEINPDTRDFLKKIEAPIGVVAVAGMYRTGKSYLLNRMLLNQSNGFDVGPTINPCTKVSCDCANVFARAFGSGADR